MSNSMECIADDDCEDCNLAVGIGQLLNVCNVLGGKDCDEMFDKIMSEEMEPIELVETMIDRAKGTDQRGIVSEIIILMS